MKLFELGRKWELMPEDKADPPKTAQRYREKKHDQGDPKALPRLALAIDEEGYGSMLARRPAIM